MSNQFDEWGKRISSEQQSKTDAKTWADNYVLPIFRDSVRDALLAVKEEIGASSAAGYIEIHLFDEKFRKVEPLGCLPSLLFTFFHVGGDVYRNWNDNEYQASLYTPGLRRIQIEGEWTVLPHYLIVKLITEGQITPYISLMLSSSCSCIKRDGRSADINLSRTIQLAPSRDFSESVLVEQLRMSFSIFLSELLHQEERLGCNEH